MAALGPEVAAVLGNDQATVDRIRSASSSTDEPVWQMPLESTRYRKLLDSVAADMRNIGGPYGGCITAAIFLSEFVGDVPWAHIDIAGPVWGKEGGATGFGVKLLSDWVLAHDK